MNTFSRALPHPSFLINAFFTIFLGINWVTSPLTARALVENEALKLRVAMDTVFHAEYEASVLKHELEGEIVVGRALLLMERKKAWETEARQAKEEFMDFYNALSAEIKWLDEWYHAYLGLIWENSSKQAFYRHVGTEKSREYSELVDAFRESMKAVIESDGESSKVEAMKKIREEVSALESNIDASLKSSGLEIEEGFKLKESVFTVFRSLYDASVIEHELEGETVIGRALLLMEKKNVLEGSAKKELEELEPIYTARSRETPWLREWRLAHFVLTHATPSRLAYYERVNKEKSEEYSKLATALQRSLIEVVKSNGEESKVEEMKKIQENISLLNEGGPR